MKSTYLTRDDIKAGSETSLPAYFRLTQFNNGWGSGYENTYGINGYRNKLVGNLAGTSLSGGDFEYTIDCKHEYPVPESVNIPDPFISINAYLKSAKNPAFKREELEKDFIILEMPDYGHQAMSPFFRDYVPQIWINGMKIWQAYVGTIKRFVDKSSYLLISKRNNLGTVKTVTREDEATHKKTAYIQLNNNDIDDIVIRVVYKNNIEDRNGGDSVLGDGYNSDPKKKIFSIKDKSNEQDPNGQYKFVLELDPSDPFIQLYAEQNPYDTYDLFFYDPSLEEPLRIINSRDFYHINFVPTDDINYRDIVINKQGSSTMDGKLVEDYFKQSYLRDYQDEDPDNEYVRPVKYHLELSVNFNKLFLEKNSSKNYKFILKHRANSLDAIYLDFSSTKTITYIKGLIPFYETQDLSIYSRLGLREEVRYTNNGTSIAIEDAVEIIPEYSSSKKYQWKNVVSTDSLVAVEDSNHSIPDLKELYYYVPYIQYNVNGISKWNENYNYFTFNESTGFYNPLDLGSSSSDGGQQYTIGSLDPSGLGYRVFYQDPNNMDFIKATRLKKFELGYTYHKRKNTINPAISVRNILYLNQIYPWNIKEAEWLTFREGYLNGFSTTEDIIPNSDDSTIIIYTRDIPNDSFNIPDASLRTLTFTESERFPIEKFTDTPINKYNVSTDMQLTYSLNPSIEGNDIYSDVFPFNHDNEEFLAVSAENTRYIGSSEIAPEPMYKKVGDLWLFNTGTNNGVSGLDHNPTDTDYYNNLNVYFEYLEDGRTSFEKNEDYKELEENIFNLSKNIIESYLENHINTVERSITDKMLYIDDQLLQNDFIIIKDDSDTEDNYSCFEFLRDISSTEDEIRYNILGADVTKKYRGYSVLFLDKGSSNFATAGNYIYFPKVNNDSEVKIFAYI